MTEWDFGDIDNGRTPRQNNEKQDSSRNLKSWQVGWKVVLRLPETLMTPRNLTHAECWFCLSVLVVMCGGSWQLNSSVNGNIEDVLQSHNCHLSFVCLLLFQWPLLPLSLYVSWRKRGCLRATRCPICFSFFFLNDKLTRIMSCHLTGLFTRCLKTLSNTTQNYQLSLRWLYMWATRKQMLMWNLAVVFL